MSNTIQKKKKAYIDSLLKTLSESQADEELEVFAQDYCKYIADENIETLSVEDQLGAIKAVYSFAQSVWKQGKPSAVRIYNPDQKKDGFYTPHTIIEAINPDMPFLVDTLGLILAEHSLQVLHLAHPTLVEPNGGKFSTMQVMVNPVSDPQLIEDVEESLKGAFTDVHYAVADWERMRAVASQAVEDLSLAGPDLNLMHVEESMSFVTWLLTNHFTFLGHRSVTYQDEGDKSRLIVEEGTGLGILRDPNFQLFDGLQNMHEIPMEIRESFKQPQLMRVVKANKRSRVHRNAHIDVVLIKRFGEDGQAIGEHSFAGLFTSTAYNQPALRIPYLRGKVDAVAQALGYATGSHDAKTLENILNSYPRDELFQISVADLKQNAIRMLDLHQRPRPAVLLRTDPFQRHITAITYLPRERFSSQLRNDAGQYLAKALNATLSRHYTEMSEDPLARILYILKTTPGQIPPYTILELEAGLRETCRDWMDHLVIALNDTYGPEKGLHYRQRYQNAFPVSYQEAFDKTWALSDIAAAQQIMEDEDKSPIIYLHRPDEASPQSVRVRIYRFNRTLTLSDAVPMLEGMGLHVINERPFSIHPLESDDDLAQTLTINISDFGLEMPDSVCPDLDTLRSRFAEAFMAIWNGVAENDGFNRLLIEAGLEWRPIMVIRAYSKYLQQAGTPFSQDYMQATLARNATIAKNLSDLFAARFDPALSEKKRTEQTTDLVSQIEAGLEGVTSLDEDRILRRFLNLILSTLRTNYYQKDENGNPSDCLAFKFASQDIEELPKPVPLREIFVYSPRFEAVHLRFGLVARGGLRWSDRREDFRTEILGLVKAQQVKNAVIVPVGSKGGFVLKQPPPASDRAAFMEEGITCYKRFIGSMLDITDNLVKGAVVPPDDLVRYDADDPYLVVAADKGTASFSDYANGVAIEKGFWLGDAFASGGSVGYDHKQMGITARGGWEAVKRHFRERGKDIQNEDFTVIGVGDMSGDVFGNGMILSKHIRLQAAFNHLHIFLDPDPDAASSFKERERLFKDVKGWGDYNQKLLSKGGGIFERSAKSISLTPEIKAMLGLSEDQLPPATLLKHILRMDAELLWFGGIGTYVKSAQESHADVGDRANDSIRVDANELNCHVIGEGANLGVTQQARVDFARHGGAVNSDAIDNSAGVDCSDHEVNIKILLNAAIEGGSLADAKRNPLLEDMTDEVADLVLRNNYQQTGSLSVTMSVASQNLDRHQRLMRALERHGGLDRAIEFLPNEEEIQERMQHKEGLTRPELAVLLAYAKNSTYQIILDSSLPDDSYMMDDLVNYFPTPLRKDHLKTIEQHKLRREITATQITNSMLNRAGPDFINETERLTGASPDAIARAYVIVRDAFDLRAFWKAIEETDNQMPAQLQSRMFHESRRTLERMSVWFLNQYGHDLNMTDMVQRFHSTLKTFADNLPKILPPPVKKELEDRQKSFEGPGKGGQGAPAALSQRAGQLKLLSTGCDVIRLNEAAPDWSVIKLGQVYTKIGNRFSLDRLRTAADTLQRGESNWNRLALSALIDDLWALQFSFTKIVLDQAKPDEADPLKKWEESNVTAYTRIDHLLSDLDALATLDLAMLSVASRELRTLIRD